MSRRLTFLLLAALLAAAVPAAALGMNGLDAGRRNLGAGGLPSGLVGWATYGDSDGGSPVLDNGRVFVVSRPQGAFTLDALDAGTGERLWRHELFTLQDLQAPRAPGVYLRVSPPTVSGGSVYLTDTLGGVWRLDAATGAVAWTMSAGGALPLSAVLSSPLLADGRLVVVANLGGQPDADYRLRALDVATQQWAWTSPVPLPLAASPTDHAVGRLASAGGNLYGITTTQGAGTGNLLQAWDAGNGQPQWSASVPNLYPAEPVAAEGRVLVAFTRIDGELDNGQFTPTSGTLQVKAYNAGGQQLWSFDRVVPASGRKFDWGYAGSLAAQGDTVAVAGWDGLYVLDAAAGTVRWQQDLGGPVQGTPVLLSDAVVAVRAKPWQGEAGPQVQAFARSDGQPRWALGRPGTHPNPGSEAAFQDGVLVARANWRPGGSDPADRSPLVAFGFDRVAPAWAPSPGEATARLEHWGTSNTLTLAWAPVADLNLAHYRIEGRPSADAAWGLVAVQNHVEADGFANRLWTVQSGSAQLRVVPVDRAGHQGPPSAVVDVSASTQSSGSSSTGAPPTAASGTPTPSSSGSSMTGSSTGAPTPQPSMSPSPSGGPGGGGGGGGSAPMASQTGTPTSQPTGSGSPRSSTGLTYAAGTLGTVTLDSPGEGSTLSGNAVLRGQVRAGSQGAPSAVTVWAASEADGELVPLGEAQVAVDGSWTYSWDTAGRRGDGRLLEDGAWFLSYGVPGDDHRMAFTLANGHWTKTQQADVDFHGPPEGPLNVNVTWTGSTGFRPGNAWIVVTGVDGPERLPATLGHVGEGDQPGQYRVTVESRQSVQPAGRDEAITVTLELEDADGGWMAMPLGQRPAPGTTVRWSVPGADGWAAPAAAGLAATLVTASIVVSTEAGRFWLLRLAPMALFSRIRGEKAREHTRREQLMLLVEGRPGITFRELGREAGLRGGVLAHHVSTLEREGLLRRQRIGTRLHFHPSGPAAPPVRQLPDLHRQLLALAKAAPISQADAARRLGMTRQALHYHVVKLREAGLLTATPHGRETLLGLAPGAAPRLWTCPGCRSLLDGARAPTTSCPSCGLRSGAAAGVAAAG